MKKLLFFSLCILLCFPFCACDTSPQSNILKIYVDGAAFSEISSIASAFMADIDGITVEVEEIPQVKFDYDENYMPVIDTDSQAERQSILQRHRTALMAGSSDADLYLITGGTSQYYEMNGGALVQDPYDLMSSGVLADLSALTKQIDSSDYLTGVFEAGQVNKVQYLIPLRVSLNGIIIDAEDNVEFPKTQNEFVSLVKNNYIQELSRSGLGGFFTLPTISYPVVNKATETVFLYDKNYSDAIALGKECTTLIQMYPSNTENIIELLDSGTLIMAGVNPLLMGSYIGSNLERANRNADLKYIPVPNEKDGVTVEITAFAFAPATSNNQEAIVTFLKWILSKDAQSGIYPIFSSLGGGYPVLKNCSGKTFASTNLYSGTLDYIGMNFIDSLSDYENRVTDAKFTTHYDFELLNLFRNWQNGSFADIDTALMELHNDWKLYLDE